MLSFDAAAEERDVTGELRGERRPEGSGDARWDAAPRESVGSDGDVLCLQLHERQSQRQVHVTLHD